jgi:hypothetical protein
LQAKPDGDGTSGGAWQVAVQDSDPVRVCCHPELGEQLSALVGHRWRRDLEVVLSSGA